MNANACQCDFTLGNTGAPNCKTIFEVPKKFIFTSYYTSTGAVNELDISGALDSAQFLALVANADDKLKWFPTPDVDGVTMTRGENVYETLPSGKKVFIQEGQNDVGFFFVELDSVFLGKLKSIGCGDMGFFEISTTKDLIGMNGSTATKLAPIKFDSETFSALLQRKTYDSSQKINVMLQYDSAMRDEDLRIVKYSELSYDLHNLSGLVDIIGAVPTSISTTGFTMKMNTYYGTILNPLRVKGLVAGDFTLYNVTDSSAVTITTCVEGTGANEGQYAFTFTAQTSADVLRLSCTEAGYDDTVLETVAITIP